VAEKQSFEMTPPFGVKKTSFEVTSHLEEKKTKYLTRH
jgi:hypothetical protein